MIVTTQYCDHCAKEVAKLMRIELGMIRTGIYKTTQTDLCEECAKSFDAAVNELIHRFKEGMAMRGGKL